MLPDSSLHSLINQQRVRDGLALPSHPPFPFTLSVDHSASLSSPPPVGVSPLPPSQLKDRVQPLGPFSGDRGPKEPRRDSPSSPALQPSVGGAPLLKPRRHSDADKPKGKRPCKTKHTSLKEREKKKEGTLNSPGQRCIGTPILGAAEDEKVSVDTSVWPQYGVWMFFAVCSLF